MSSGRGAGSTDSAAAGSAGAADAGEPRPAGVEMIAVNRGTQGLRSTTRWVLSSDRRAIVVVEDAISIEGDPLPDGFVYANEATGVVAQIDGVWDVAPSPDWTRLAFGRAYVLHARERDTMPAAEWRRVEAELPEDLAGVDPRSLRGTLEARAFPVSGMTLMLGLGLTQVIWVDRLVPGRSVGAAASTQSLNGWRVRWTPSGDTLAAGAGPSSTYDDASPSRWVLIRPRLGAGYGDSLGVTTDSSRFARVAWTDGPTTEYASPVDLSGRRELAVDGGTIESRDGTIRLTTYGAGGRRETRLVGPGRALAATARGRFILALVPRAQGKEHEMRAYPVVYHVSPR